ncbi:MAG: dihydrodipicolinate synthase family protein [Candidatus Helarchaeota archaeon]
MKIKGVIPAMITIFNANGSIDHESMVKHIDYLIGKGIKSLVILGSTGEFAYLSQNEKKALIENVGKILNTNYPKIQLIVGISSTNVKEAIELGLIAQNNHADCVMAALPTYFPLEKKDIIRFYNEISNNLKIPLLAYNFPIATKLDLTPRILVELAETGAIIGVKETGVSIDIIKEMLETAPTNFTTIIGTDLMLKSALDLGIRSAILGSGNYIPEYLIEFFNLYEMNENKDSEKIDELWKYISKKVSILTYGISLLPSIIKSALIILGQPISPYVRSPLPDISEKLKKKIEKILLK